MSNIAHTPAVAEAGTEVLAVGRFTTALLHVTVERVLWFGDYPHPTYTVRTGNLTWNTQSLYSLNGDRLTP